MLLEEVHKCRACLGVRRSPAANPVPLPPPAPLSREYPSVPPAANFPKGFLHVNVFENGGVCLSILKTEMPEVGMGAEDCISYSISSSILRFLPCAWVAV